MNEQRRRRTAVIWIAFAFVMTYVTLSDGFSLGVGDLLGVVAMALGLGLAYVYYANPRDVLDFGERDP